MVDFLEKILKEISSDLGKKESASKKRSNVFAWLLLAGLAVFLKLFLKESPLKKNSTKKPKSVEKKESLAREVLHVNDLEINDIIEFSFFEIANLSEQKVTVVDKHQLNTLTNIETSVVFQDLQGQQYLISNITFYMKEFLALTRELTRQEFESLFNETDLKQVFNQGHLKNLKRESTYNKSLETWTACEYYEHIDGIEASKRLTKFNKEFDFKLYRLVSEAKDFGIDIYMLPNGNRFAYVNRYFDVSVVKAFWPA